MKILSGAPLTYKGELTRERILGVALQLFNTAGYEATTMRQIAARAGSSPGLAYRYFGHKEDLVLEFYRRMAAGFEAEVQAIPRASLADRFERAMRAKLELVHGYRPVFAAVLGSAMSPDSKIAVLGDRAADVRQRVRNAFANVVTGADDAPQGPQAGQMATVLYGLHLGLLLFWLHDRSANSRATWEMLAFTREMLALVRPALRLRPVARALARLEKLSRSIIRFEA
jgi:AcrR family transcriptional regulator